MFNRFLFTLTVLIAVSASGLGSVPSDSRGAEPQVVSVVARRFAFEPSTITVTVGQPVRLMVHSEDGVHGMEIKKFKVNKDIPRGNEAVIINFTPTAVGEFPIMCSEYCGDGHDDMRGTLVVKAQAAAPQP